MEIGIITTPREHAQDVADAYIRDGVKVFGILHLQTLRLMTT